MTIEMTTVVARDQGALTAPVDDEIVILNPEGDNYLGLDHIGRAVWELLETPQRLTDLCQRLSDDFDATPDAIAADIVPFVAEMVDEGVVHVVEGWSGHGSGRDVERVSRCSRGRGPAGGVLVLPRRPAVPPGGVVEPADHHNGPRERDGPR